MLSLELFVSLGVLEVALLAAEEFQPASVLLFGLGWAPGGATWHQLACVERPLRIVALLSE